MKKYLLKRLLRLIPVFLGVTILAFLLTGLSSVDAVDLKESSSGEMCIRDSVWTEKFGQSAITSEVLGMDGAKNYAKENQMTETWDASLGQNVATVETSDARYTIWMEDEQSMEEKLKVIQSADLAGVAEWKLGFERADVWSLISEYIETNS